MLSAYVKMKRSKPKLELEFLETLLEMKEQNQLREYAQEHMCED